MLTTRCPTALLSNTSAPPRANPQDPSQPVKWLSDLFGKYLPATIAEMRRAFSHITPLSTMNFVTVRGRER